MKLSLKLIIPKAHYLYGDLIINSDLQMKFLNIGTKNVQNISIVAELGSATLKCSGATATVKCSAATLAATMAKIIGNL